MAHTELSSFSNLEHKQFSMKRSMKEQDECVKQAWEPSPLVLPKMNQTSSGPQSPLQGTVPSPSLFPLRKRFKSDAAEEGAPPSSPQAPVLVSVPPPPPPPPPVPLSLPPPQHLLSSVPPPLSSQHFSSTLPDSYPSSSNSSLSSTPLSSTSSSSSTSTSNLSSTTSSYTKPSPYSSISSICSSPQSSPLHSSNSYSFSVEIPQGPPTTLPSLSSLGSIPIPGPPTGRNRVTNIMSLLSPSSPPSSSSFYTTSSWPPAPPNHLQTTDFNNDFEVHNHIHNNSANYSNYYQNSYSPHIYSPMVPGGPNLSTHNMNGMYASNYFMGHMSYPPSSPGPSPTSNNNSRSASVTPQKKATLISLPTSLFVEASRQEPPSPKKKGPQPLQHGHLQPASARQLKLGGGGGGGSSSMRTGSLTGLGSGRLILSVRADGNKRWKVSFQSSDGPSASTFDSAKSYDPNTRMAKQISTQTHTLFSGSYSSYDSRANTYSRTDGVTEKFNLKNQPSQPGLGPGSSSSSSSFAMKDEVVEASGLHNHLEVDSDHRLTTQGDHPHYRNNSHTLTHPQTHSSQSQPQPQPHSYSDEDDNSTKRSTRRRPTTNGTLNGSMNAKKRPSSASSGESYCLCHKTIDQVMIACDSCDDWFHVGCVGLSPALAKKIKVYTCPRCKSPSPHESDGDPQWTNNVSGASTSKRTSRNSSGGTSNSGATTTRKKTKMEKDKHHSLNPHLDKSPAPLPGRAGGGMAPTIGYSQSNSHGPRHRHEQGQTRSSSSSPGNSPSRSLTSSATDGATVSTLNSTKRTGDTLSPTPSRSGSPGPHSLSGQLPRNGKVQPLATGAGAGAGPRIYQGQGQSHPATPGPLGVACRNQKCYYRAAPSSNYCSVECAKDWALEKIAQTREAQESERREAHLSALRSMADDKNPLDSVTRDDFCQLEALAQRLAQANAQFQGLDAVALELDSAIRRAASSVWTWKEKETDEDLLVAESLDSIDCISCGKSVSHRELISHLDKCVAKKFTKPSRLSQDEQCHHYDSTIKVFCSTLLSQCPNATLVTKVEERQCGCPSQDFKSGYCERQRSSCIKHPGWQSLKKSQFNQTRSLLNRTIANLKADIKAIKTRICRRNPMPEV
eukprot:TRINITY_DN2554_c0_g2_i1.p1 TRINITY_DN2554_c0_g2~~TRINITY_DN2554_c0_g2_i1.p1  ORF type:complete len:1121 (+),score=243.59 TRINITY_DN2554_c0_g2_i1:54-3416(+)